MFDPPTTEFMMGATGGALLVASLFSSELRSAFVVTFATLIGSLIAIAVADEKVSQKLSAEVATFVCPNPMLHPLFIVGAVAGALFVILVRIRNNRRK